MIKPPNLQYPLFDIKDQLQCHPQLDFPANIESDIWSYYKFLKIQASVLTDISIFILTIPMVDKCLTFHVYMIHNILLLQPTFKKSFQYEKEHRYFAVRSHLHYKPFPHIQNILTCVVS